MKAPREARLLAVATIVLMGCGGCAARTPDVPPTAPDAAVVKLRAFLNSIPSLPVEIVHLQTAPAVTFGMISAVAGDRNGNLYVLHRPQSGDPIVALDPTGRVLRTWGAGRFTMPHGIRVDADDNVWTTDATTSVVTKFSPAGEVLLEIRLGPTPDPSRSFCGTTDVTFAPEGHVLVADGYCNARVVEFDRAGRRVREWGRRGSGPGELDVPHAIAMGADGHVYIADRENGRVQRFTREGRFLDQWRFGGQVYSLTFTPDGSLYAGVRVPGNAPGTPPEGSILRVDLSSGRALGRVPLMAHELNATPGGALLPATPAGIVLVHPR